MESGNYKRRDFFEIFLTLLRSRVRRVNFDFVKINSIQFLTKLEILSDL